jgi:predicted ATPase
VIPDNLGQLADLARDLHELLTRCPGLRLMATSRTVLGLQAEREYPVPAPHSSTCIPRLMRPAISSL